MATREAVVDADRPIVQAHRGFAGVAPENTILAARTAAVRFDADWIEVDVQPTADGTVVCYHDPALDEGEGSRGITDGSGLVRATATADVLATEVLDSGETIPRLAEFLEAVPPGVGVNVELKSPGGPVDDSDGLFQDDTREDQRALWDEFVADVATVVADGEQQTDGERPILFSSFFEGALAAAREHAPDVPRAVIPVGDLQDGLAIADRQNASAINAPADLLERVGTPFVEQAHHADLAVNGWTITEWTTCRDLVAIGVDGVIADYPFLDATW